MMVRRRTAPSVAQAWVELATADPEAVSALAVARAHLPAGRGLKSLRRLRLFELLGPLPARAEIETLLHRSIQFYNPHKERCTVRLAADEETPIGAGERGVLVFDRGEERREGAERWWRHETGKAIEVREGVAWVLGIDPSVRDAAAAVEELTVLRDRRHGLLCNPQAQEHRLAAAEIPLPWMTAAS
jgi:hypothetical protein